MLYHQNSLAQVNAGFSRLRASNTFSPCTRPLFCFQNPISAVSRKYQPMATMPLRAGGVPVSMTAWLVQVTAGNGSRRRALHPSRRKAAMRGVWGPIREGVRPTTFRTAVSCIRIHSAFPRQPRGVRVRCIVEDEAQFAGYAPGQARIVGGAMGFGKHAPGVSLHLEMTAEIPGQCVAVGFEHFPAGGGDRRVLQHAGGVDGQVEMHAPGMGPYIETGRSRTRPG